MKNKFTISNFAQKELDKKYAKLMSLQRTFLGYPCDAEFDYSPLYRFLKFPMNNVGDPFESSTYRIETKDFERDVLRFFAKLYHIKDFWGYMTNGGTEGNLYGMYLGREHLPGATVFFSEHTHYSIKKNAHILGLKSCIVKSDKYGRISYSDLKKQLKGHKKAIIVANVGTTMTGAIDNIPMIMDILKKARVKYYVHVDAALYGMILPFVSKTKFDFRSGIASMAVSGHKFVGSPIPCGIVLAKKKKVDLVDGYIQYIDAHDTTISGSRDAFTPLVVWYRIKTLGIHGFKKYVLYSLDLANYLVKELNKIGWPDVKKSYVTVSFKKPSFKLIKKWELAANNNIAHVICMPHEDKAELNAFIADMKKEL